jgi:tRNA pseudouridine55 synthase
VTSGILFVDKPIGPTSHRVVSVARKALGIKKVGHAGTLDPMASGLMTLGVGQSTRLLTFLVGLNKTYQATMSLGHATITDDAEGEIVGPPATAEQLDAVDAEGIREALLSFVGDISQKPSAVSAIKVDGERAYDLVRRGIDVELKARPVTIHGITIDSIERRESDWSIRCEVRCSSGTYVRAIARDLGEKMGIGGHLTALRRTMVGPWSVEQAVSPDDISADVLIDPATIISQVLPTVSVDRPTQDALSHGKRIRLPDSPHVPDDQAVAVMGVNHQLVAIVSGVSGPVRILVGFPAEGVGRG